MFDDKKENRRKHLNNNKKKDSSKKRLRHDDDDFAPKRKSLRFHKDDTRADEIWEEWQNSSDQD